MGPTVRLVGYPDIAHDLVYADTLAEAGARAADWAILPLPARCEPGWRLELRSPPWAVYRQAPVAAADRDTVPQMQPSLSIIMPVFNELSTVEAAIDDALTAELPVDARQLVIVDDGSTDGTRELLASKEWPAEVTLVEHERNRGKGAALQTGLQHATGEWAAILDADLEYRAADLGPLLEPLLNGDARVVFGTRSWSSHAAFSFWYVIGNKGVTTATNVIYNCWISDVMTCHKAMSTELFRSLRSKSAASRSNPRSRQGVARRRADLRSADHVQGAVPGGGEEADDARRASRLRTLVRCRID